VERGEARAGSPFSQETVAWRGSWRYRMPFMERYCIKGQELLGTVATAVVAARDGDPISQVKATAALFAFNEHIRTCRACADFSSLEKGETIH
jgi:hypothetical protein